MLTGFSMGRMISMMKKLVAFCYEVSMYGALLTMLIVPTIILTTFFQIGFSGMMPTDYSIPLSKFFGMSWALCTGFAFAMREKYDGR